jgi:MFS transporter, AAHS family, 4-hydroxybenzoate transporter
MSTAPSFKLDVGSLLDHGRWTAYQKLLTFLAALAVTFDGFDIQILGFSIPSMMADWHVARSAFPPVIAVGLIGMAMGAPLAGYLGDRFGRRFALIGSVLVFGSATLATAFCNGMTELTALRFLTGIGAGGALPNASALASEFAPLRKRPVAVTFTSVCIPVGGMLGGLAAARILPNWRTLYGVGGVSALLLAVILYWGLPESPRFMTRRPERWRELTRLLSRFGHSVPPAAAFEDVQERKAESQGALKSLFGSGYLRDTAGLWIAFFCCMNAVYLVFSWLPSMLAAQGLDTATASSGLAAYNFGGVLGVLICAPMIGAVGSRRPLLLGAIIGAATALGLRFIAPGDHALLIAGYGLHGLFANAVQTALFALAAHVYPTKVRASGVAASAAVGRLGALLSSVTGAVIIQAGSGTYLGVLALSLLSGAVGIAVVKKQFSPNAMASPGPAR